jgi:tRNA 2-selenouridine synthase
MFVLGGMTGSSKTHILKRIGLKGHQVIDLEKMACHKGSAFGSLGQPPQPSTEQFANDLFREWQLLDPARPVWLEDESRNIGTVFLPENFYNNMQESKTIVLMMDIQTRLPRLMEEYSVYPPDELRTSIMKISKRLGGDNTHEALDAINSGDISKAIEISLRYYDKAYHYSIKRKSSTDIVYLSTDTDDVEVNAIKVLGSVGL